MNIIRLYIYIYHISRAASLPFQQNSECLHAVAVPSRDHVAPPLHDAILQGRLYLILQLADVLGIGGEVVQRLRLCMCVVKLFKVRVKG